MRTEESYLRWQMFSEAIALAVNWLLIIAFVLDFTNVKVLVAGEGLISTFTVIWWMKWERARLPVTEATKRV